MDLNAVMGLQQKHTSPLSMFRPEGSGNRYLGLHGQGTSHMMDNVEVSETAKQAYLEEENNDPNEPDLMNKFRLALIQFSNYALHINGRVGNATPMEGLYALAELANRSGIQMPGNLTEGKEELLEQFKTAWGLDDNSTVEDILAKMKEVFNDDRSYITHIPSEFETENPPYTSVTEAGAAGATSATNTDSVTAANDDRYNKALKQFTIELFDKKGVEREPQRQDYKRVLNVLSDKLGIPYSTAGLDLDAIIQAMDMPADASVNDIVREMARIFQS